MCVGVRVCLFVRLFVCVCVMCVFVCLVGCVSVVCLCVFMSVVIAFGI